MTMESFYSGIELIATNIFPEEEDQNARTEKLIDHLLENI
jgi:hypothetical protein